MEQDLEFMDRTRPRYRTEFGFVTDEIEPECLRLDRTICHAETKEQIAFASRYSGILTFSKEDRMKLQAWKGFLKSREKLDADEILARISLYNMTGEPPFYFLGEVVNGRLFDERICDQLRGAAENWVLLMASDELGTLYVAEPDEDGSALPPAATFKAYMDAYKAEKGFRSWNLERVVDIGAEIYKVVDAFRRRKEGRGASPELTVTAEINSVSLPPRSPTRPRRAKRARVVEYSEMWDEDSEDEDGEDKEDNISSQLKLIQKQQEEINMLKQENCDLKAKTVDSDVVDALKNEIAKLQSRISELTISNTEDDQSHFPTQMVPYVAPSVTGSTETVYYETPTTLSGQASVLEHRLDVARERVTVESQLCKEAETRYKKAQADYAKLTKKRDEAARILNFINEV